MLPSSSSSPLHSMLRIIGFVFLSPRIWQGLTEWQRRRLTTTTLTEACYAEDLIKCKELIEEGVDCNQKGKDGFPLIAAAEKGNVDIVRLLLEHGADTTKANESGETALLSASHHRHLAVVALIIQHGADKDTACFLNMTALYYAAQNGHLEVVRYLIDQGCCVDKADLFGRTALHAAAQRGHTDVVICLMQHGMANLNARDRQDRLPIDLADNKHNVAMDHARCEATKQAIRDEEERRKECCDHRINNVVVKVVKKPYDYEQTLDRLTAANTKINSNSKWLRVNFGEVSEY